MLRTELGREASGPLRNSRFHLHLHFSFHCINNISLCPNLEVHLHLQVGIHTISSFLLCQVLGIYIRSQLRFHDIRSLLLCVVPRIRSTCCSASTASAASRCGWGCASGAPTWMSLGIGIVGAQ